MCEARTRGGGAGKDSTTGVVRCAGRPRAYYAALGPDRPFIPAMSATITIAMSLVLVLSSFYRGCFGSTSIRTILL